MQLRGSDGASSAIFDEAQRIVESGGRWLDVRLPSEFENFHRADAINPPLYVLRLKLKALDKKTQHVVCCDSGQRSSASAFILNANVFDAAVVKGGLAANSGGDVRREHAVL